MSRMTGPVVGAVHEYQTDGPSITSNGGLLRPAAWFGSPGSVADPDNEEAGATVTVAGAPLRAKASAKSSLAGGSNTATYTSKSRIASPGLSTAIEYVVPATASKFRNAPGSPTPLVTSVRASTASPVYTAAAIPVPVKSS